MLGMHPVPSSGYLHQTTAESFGLLQPAEDEQDTVYSGQVYFPQTQHSHIEVCTCEMDCMTLHNSALDVVTISAF